jgi:DNA-binding response OmpR family regulator
MATILVVEDDPSNLQVIGTVLRSQGYHVLGALTGREAIETCRRFSRPIDVLITDLRLSDTCGTDVAVKVGESRPETAILFISGSPIDAWPIRDRKAFRALAPVGVDFLEKPFGVGDLLGKVERLIDRNAHVSGSVSTVSNSSFARVR